MNAGPLEDSSWEMPTLEIQRQTRFISGVHICLVWSQWPRGLVCFCEAWEHLFNIFNQAHFKVYLMFFSLRHAKQGHVRHGRWGRTGPAFRKKLSLSQMTFRRKKCRNVRKGTDNSSDSLQPRLTRPSLFPGGKEMNRKTGWEKHRVGPGCGAPISLCLSHRLSLSLSISMRNLL